MVLDVFLVGVAVAVEAGLGAVAEKRMDGMGAHYNVVVVNDNLDGMIDTGGCNDHRVAVVVVEEEGCNAVDIGNAVDTGTGYEEVLVGEKQLVGGVGLEEGHPYRDQAAGSYVRYMPEDEVAQEEGYYQDSILKRCRVVWNLHGD